MFIKSYKQKIKKLNIFDVNWWIGPIYEPLFFYPNLSSIEEIKKTLLYFGIKEAVITHTLSKYYNFKYGNALSIKLAKSIPEIYVSAVIIPEEISSLRKYIKKLKEEKVKIIRIFPEFHNFDIFGKKTFKVFEILEESFIPLILQKTELSWKEIRQICKDFPSLNIILEPGDRKLFYYNRIYYELLEEYKNFYIEITGVVSYLELDEIVKKFGSTKIIFGSNFPFSDPNAFIPLIINGNFSDEDKNNISRENLKKILGD